MADEKAAEMETDEEGPNSASSPKQIQQKIIKIEKQNEIRCKENLKCSSDQDECEPMDIWSNIKPNEVEEENKHLPRDKSSPRKIVGRPRTYSTGQLSSMSLNVDCNSTSPSPISIGSPAPRVIQIKREESVDELTREVAKERDITSAINLSRSWDELSWLGSEKHFAVTNDANETKQDSIDELMFNSLHPDISSPVRFIDKLHYTRSLTPSPISVPISPKQRTFRRSLSPSSLRPSLLASKRKLDPDDLDSFTSPAKRHSLFYSPASTLSSVSSNSSPDHHSDFYSHRLSSCDDDSGSDCFIPQSTSSSTTNSNISIHTPNMHSSLTCDTRSNNHQSSFAFVKPRYVAPQSPLAAGVNSGGLHNSQAPETNRKSSLTTVVQNYTSFTPVKESART